MIHKFSEKKFVALIMVIAVLLLLLPGAIRLFYHQPMSGVIESYTHTRLLGSGSYDAVQDRVVGIQLLYFIPLGALKPVIILFLPALLGVLTVLLSYLLFKEHNISLKHIRATLLLLVISPIFIYMYSSFTLYGVIVVLSLLGLYLFLKNQWLSLVIFGILPFIDWHGSLITFIFIVLYFAITENMKSAKWLVILFASMLCIVAIVNITIGYNLLTDMQLASSPFITEIGARVGVSFAVLILCVLGFVLLLERGLKNVLAYTGIFLLMVLSIFNIYLRIYLNLIIVMYAAVAFTYLFDRKWSIVIIKKTTLMLIVCGILFSTLSYTTTLMRAEPTQELVSALTVVKNQALANERILSLPEEAPLMNYYATHATVMDNSLSSQKDYEVMIKSRNLDVTESLFQKYHVRYIVITPGFKRELDAEQGLIFLIQHSNKFVRIYTNEKVDVWMYVQ